jgi:transcriptional regulator with XRE-family HTH domain
MNAITERIRRLVASARSGHTYKVERAILEFTERIYARMLQKGISPSALAERMGVEPPYVSKILRGTSNFTLDSMIKICSAVDTEFCFHVRPKEVTAAWVEYEYLSSKIRTHFHASGSENVAKGDRYNVTRLDFSGDSVGRPSNDAASAAVQSSFAKYA